MAADINELKKRLNIFFNGNSDLVSKYIETFGEVLSMKNINELRKAVEENANAEVLEDGDDPLYEVEVECPVCKKKEISFYELKAKSQFLTYDQFHTPIYSGINSYRDVKYSHYAVTICPKCYFASPDKRDFITHNKFTKQSKESKLNPSILSELLETMGERMTVVDELPMKEGLFSFPRNFQSAITSYRIAIERVNVELRHREPYAYFKRGAYWLKIALIQRQNSVNDSPSLEMAAESFKQAFLNSDFPNANLEFQAIYSNFAIYLKMNEVQEGRKFLGIMDQALIDYESGKRPDPAIPVAVKTWKDKAMELWESREDDDLWELPKIQKS
jgi:uncharacterized protein (DUF2225 family)